MPIVIIAIAVPVLLPLLLIAGAWYYTNLLRREALQVEYPPPRPDLEVMAVDGDTVLLRNITGRPNGNWSEPGVFGLQWEGGYARTHRLLDGSRDTVLRELEAVTGDLEPGIHVRLDVFAYPADPRAAHGFDYEDVSVRSDVGELPAWLVPGARSTWVIVVHGKGASRGEALRVLPALRRHEYPVLVISYRNDEGVGADLSGHFQYGATEWADLEAAVEYARAAGAERVILYGISMGAAICMSFMRRSQLAGCVEALVFDSPLLDLALVVEARSRQRGAPGFAVWLGKKIARVRFGLDWHELNYLLFAGQLDVPVLVFHGTRDGLIPVEQSDFFAELRPDIVTYHRIEGARHVRTWNIDPAAYERALDEFLTRLESRPAIADEVE